MHIVDGLVEQTSQSARSCFSS